MKSIRDFINLIETAQRAITEAPVDSKFTGFMNKALGQKVDAANNKSKLPDFMQQAPVSELDSMGYKAALTFGTRTLTKLTPTQKTKLSTKGDRGVVSWLASLATKTGFIPNQFLEEDLDEVQDFFPDIFKDPTITSWALLLTDGEPLPKAPSKGPFTVGINSGIPGQNGYANADWRELDTLDNLPDATKLAQELVQRNPKQFIAIWDASGKSAGFYWPGQGWR